MTETSPRNDDWMLQLLADRATEGVEGTDAAVLDEWLMINPDIDAEAFDRAAAVVALAGTSVHEVVLPRVLRSKLLADAEAFFAWNDGK